VRFEGTGLCRRIGERTLFEGLDFAIDTGETLAIQAPSGAGKTCLLRLLAWLDPGQGGELRLDGRSPHDWTIPAWRTEVAYVAQKVPELAGSPDELVQATQRFAAWKNRAQQDPRVIAARWGLPDKAWTTTWSRLSGGEQQRAALAIALSRNPQVLLLDEPTSALDETATSAIEADLADLTVIWVTHDQAQAARVGSKKLSLAQLAPPGGAP